MAENKIRTSKRVAKKASKVLRDSRSKDARSAAGSALRNRAKKTKK